jgi:hypothetical protein
MKSFMKAGSAGSGSSFARRTHGSTLVGNGAQALHDLGCVMREVYGDGSEDTPQA